MGNDFYSVIADFYDQFQEFDVNKLPRLWAEFLDDQFKETTFIDSRINKNNYSNSERLAIDLGCGTGSVAVELANRKWRVIGIDNSEKMLEIARAKILSSSNYSELSGNANGSSTSVSDLDESDRVTFLLQDIRDFYIEEKADLIYTSLDVFNHLDGDELLQVLHSSYLQLKDNGVLIFDLHSLEYMRNDLGDNSYQSVTDDDMIIWQNDFSDSDLTNEASIIRFKREVDGRYKREDSSITEYFHYPEIIKEYLEFMDMSVKLLEDNRFVDMWDGKRIFVKAIKNV